jgi:hypothetical protein
MFFGLIITLISIAFEIMGGWAGNLANFNAVTLYIGAFAPVGGASRGFVKLFAYPTAALPIFATAPASLVGLRGVGLLFRGWPVVAIISQLFVLPELFGYSLQGLAFYATGYNVFQTMGASAVAASAGSQSSIGLTAPGTIEALVNSGVTSSTVTTSQAVWSVLAPSTFSTTATNANVLFGTVGPIFWGGSTYFESSVNALWQALAIATVGTSTYATSAWALANGGTITLSSTAMYSLLSTLAPEAVVEATPVVQTGWSWTTWIGIFVFVASVAAAVYFLLGSSQE